MNRPFSRLPEPWAFVRHFTPNWFAMTMGTGVLALVIAHLPFSFAGQWWLAQALWMLGVVLYVSFSVLLLGRVLCFRETVRPMLEHPVQSMFLGAIPMGMAVLINGLLLFCEPRWGAVVVNVAHVLWWLCAALALLSALWVPYLMFTRQEHALEKLTGVWLLPIVAPEVAANVAGNLMHYLPAGSARVLWVCGLLLWGMSLALAFSLITLILLRLAIHKLPDVSFAATSWLPLGPLATGALGLLCLTHEAHLALAGTPLENLAQSIQGLGLLGGLTLWGAGLWWFLIALLFTRRYLRQRMQFNLGWWGFTFPLGVFALATFELQRQTEVKFFAVVGVVLALLLALIWLQVMLRTLRGIWGGELFQAPCLQAPQR